MKKIYIKTDFIRLDSLLKLAGAVGTGGQAKVMISDGLAAVNGEVCLMRGKKLRGGDIVEFEGEKIEIVQGEE